MGKFNGVLFLGSFLGLALIACNLSGSVSPEESTQAVPGAEPTRAAVVHQVIPASLPPDRSGLAGDQDSSSSADQRRAPGGDRFTFGRFERPFNAEAMDVYFPQFDILDVMVYRDDTWIYAAMTLKGGDQNGALPGTYGFELDADQDGGGEWLVLAEGPFSTEWTTNGVQVWFDGDGDVGGATTINADDHGAGNGYENRVFGAEGSADPDLAWARLSPDNPLLVQIALKFSILDGDDDFMIGMWAGADDLDPALFDLNDHYTHEQAGTSLVELENFYPIKQLSELDNTCRLAVGFQPVGTEPGLCKQPIPDKEQTSCPADRIYCLPAAISNVCYCLED